VLLAGLKPAGGDETALNYWKVGFAHIFSIARKCGILNPREANFLENGPESVYFMALVSDERILTIRDGTTL